MKQIHSEHLGNYFVPKEIKGGNCIDIGGNTGQFSLKYRNFFSLIHIYEPQKDCLNIINNNLKYFNNIKIYDEAVFHTSNLFINLISHSNNDSGSVAVQDDVINVKEWSNNIVDCDIKTIDLYDIIERIGNIDYMKIDCESSEYHFLIDKDLSKIKYIGIELHWQLGEKNFNNLVNHLLKYFHNPFNTNLNYPNGYNIEVFLKSKFL